MSTSRVKGWGIQGPHWWSIMLYGHNQAQRTVVRVHKGRTAHFVKRKIFQGNFHLFFFFLLFARAVQYIQAYGELLFREKYGYTSIHCERR